MDRRIADFFVQERNCKVDISYATAIPCNSVSRGFTNTMLNPFLHRKMRLRGQPPAPIRTVVIIILTEWSSKRTLRTRLPRRSKQAEEDHCITCLHAPLPVARTGNRYARGNRPRTAAALERRQGSGLALRGQWEVQEGEQGLPSCTSMGSRREAKSPPGRVQARSAWCGSKGGRRPGRGPAPTRWSGWGLGKGQERSSSKRDETADVSLVWTGLDASDAPLAGGGCNGERAAGSPCQVAWYYHAHLAFRVSRYRFC